MTANYFLINNLVKNSIELIILIISSWLGLLSISTFLNITYVHLKLVDKYLLVYPIDIYAVI